jgi:hypothetical protein
MKKSIKITALVSMLAVGLMAGTAMVGIAGTHHGDMNGKGMHHGMKMDGKGMGCMGMKGMQGAMGMDHCKKNCMQMMDKLSAEERQAFMDQTKELRREIMTKRFDYQEMMRNPASTAQEKETMEKEMSALHDKMMEKMNTFTKK